MSRDDFPAALPGAGGDDQGNQIPCARILSLRSSISFAGSPYSERLKRLVFRCLGSSRRESKRCGVAESVAEESLAGQTAWWDVLVLKTRVSRGAVALLPLVDACGSSRPIQLANTPTLVEKGSCDGVLEINNYWLMPAVGAVCHDWRRYGFAARLATRVEAVPRL